MAVRIVSLMARIGLDGTGFQQGLRRVGTQFSQFTGSLKSQLAGAFSVAAMGMAIRNISDHVGKIKDLSEQFSVTTDEVQRLDAAAKMSGQSFDAVGTAMERLGSARKNAAEGNEELRQMFERFGVTLADLNNPAKRNIDLLQQMAAAIRSMDLTAADSQALRELFGRSGARLAAVFQDLEKVKINPIPEETIERIDRATKKLELFRLKLQELGARFLSGLNVDDFEPDFIDDLRERFGFKRRDTGGGGAMTHDEVVVANARKHFQAQKALEEGPLFDDKTKTKTDSTLPLELQAALKALMVAKGTIGVSRDRETPDLLAGVNVGETARRGRFGGLTMERAFGLQGKDDKQDKIEKNTREAATFLKRIEENIKQGGGDSLTF